MTNTPVSMLRLNFKNLPLVEAAVRISFAEELGLSMGLFFSAAKAFELKRPSFTEIRDLPALEPAPGVATVFRPGAFPGAAIADPSQSVLVSLQENLLAARWVWNAETRTPYPRYSTLRGALIDFYISLAEASTKPVAPMVANMVYVNLLPGTPSREVIARYIAADHAPAFLRGADRATVSQSWRSDVVDLRLEVVHAPTEGQAVASQLRTAAGTRFDRLPPSAPLTEYIGAGIDAVHEKLQQMFLAAISEEAKAEWQLEGRQ